MKISLIQIDGKMPNLALMKLSTYHKKLGDKIYLGEIENPDVVYISCIFPQNKEKTKIYEQKYDNVKIGGSGVSLEKELKSKIEHEMPDYDLYNGKICTNCSHIIKHCTCRNDPQVGDIDFSMGFTSRGCFRNCDFCIVPEKEGYIRDWAPITEFLHPKHNKVVLFDNNFLGSPRWRENANFLIENKIKTSFNQGLDIRLVQDDNAKAISDVWYYDYKFKRRRLYFAFDDVEYEKDVKNGIEILLSHGIKPYHLMFYVLVGFNSSFAQDIHRFNVLRKYRVKPYIMIYNNRKDNKLIRYFARWVNGRYYKIFPFEIYDRGKSQEYIQRWLENKPKELPLFLDE